MSENLSGYDNWKCRAPEDEPGYWDGREEDDNVCPECGTDFSDSIMNAAGDLWAAARKVVDSWDVGKQETERAGLKYHERYGEPELRAALRKAEPK